MFGRMKTKATDAIAEKAKALVDKKETLFSLWGGFIAKLMKMAIKIPIALMGLPKTLAVFFLASLCVGVFVVIMYFMVHLVVRVHLRLPLPSHSAPADNYLSKYCTELIDLMGRINDELGAPDGMAVLSQMSDGIKASAGALQEGIQTVLGRSDIDNDLPTMIQFRKALEKMNWFARHDIRANAPNLNTDGDLDGDKIDDFTSNLIPAMRTIKHSATDLTEAVNQLPPDMSDNAWWTPGANALLADIFLLRLLLSYEHDIWTMMRTRRKKMTFAIWEIYYVPLVEDIYKHRIPDIWIKSGTRFVVEMKKSVAWWAGIGVSIGLMPCNMAFPDPEERAKKCKVRDIRGKEGFEERFTTHDDGSFIGQLYKTVRSKVVQYGNKHGRHVADVAGGGLLSVAMNALRRDGDDAGEVGEEGEGGDDAREGYYGGNTDGDVVETVSIGKALGAITNFILNIKYLGEAIGRFGKQFPSDPLGTIIGIVSLLLGLVFGLVLLILYMIMTFTAIFWLLLVIWVTLITFVVALLNTVYLFLLSILIAIPYFVAWIIDMVTKGAVTKLLRCENLPDDWGDRHNYSQGNGYKRIDGGAICFAPCFPRYTPTGCFCKRRQAHLPDFCPHQQIYRIFRGKGVSQPYVFDKYRPVPGFTRMTLAKKQKLIIHAYRDKMSWYQTCYMTLRKYDFINRFICTTIDKLDLMDAHKEKLRVLCSECYCRYHAADKKTGITATMSSEEEINTPFCTRFTKKNTGGALGSLGDPSSMGGPGTNIIKRTILMSMLVIATLSVFYSMVAGARKILKAANA